jgi:hypothetical protein
LVCLILLDIPRAFSFPDVFRQAERGTSFNNTGLEKFAAPFGKIRLQAQRVMA